MLLKFNSHINVEVCSTVQCINYLFKYCYKGHDCAFIEISNIDLNLKDDNNSSNGKDNNQNDEYDYNEIKQYINTRYLCPPEAMNRLLEYVLHETSHETSHTIKRLAVHDENTQEVYFKEGQENKILNKNVETTLTAYYN